MRHAELNRRVLVVDDSRSVRMIARLAIEQLGLDVTEADSGHQALRRFEDDEIGLVLLDVGLPDLDGYAVAEAIRAHPRGQEVPIVMLTGRGDLESIERAFAVGATDFASKPVSWLILGQRLLFCLESTRRRVEIDLQRAELEETQRVARIGSWRYRPADGRVEISSVTRELFGLSAEGDSLETLGTRVPEEEIDRVRSMLEELISGQEPKELKHRLIDASGGERVVYSYARRVAASPFHDLWIEGSTQDITQRERAESKIRYLAQQDQLTGLRNQDFFRENLAMMLARQKREGSCHALFLLNLNNFSRINDSRGREAGDEILRTVAKRVIVAVRETDMVASGTPMGVEIARIGGDEFSIALSDIRSPTDAARVAQRILEAVSEPISLQCGELAVTARIGIALSPDDGSDVGTLIANATAADRHARELGGNAYTFYRASMNESTLSRLALEGDFRQALLRKEVLVYFQPRVAMATGRVIAAEALARWHHPERGWIPPDEFVQLAEEAGLTFEFGRSIMESVMEQMQAWRRGGYEPIPISINVSPTLLVDDRLPQLLSEVTGLTGTPNSLVEIEITETVLLRREKAAEAALGKLKALGMTIALDDFGTGYSALTHLQRFPVDVLKIDRTFIDALDTDRGRAIVRGVISMAHAMDLRVVAEGVETLAQRSFLADERCDEEQGYLVSKPVPASEFEALFWPEGASPLMMAFDDEEGL